MKDFLSSSLALSNNSHQTKISSSGRRTFAGIDFGTSGCRVAIIDAASKVLYQNAINYPNNQYDDPKAWMETLDELLFKAPNFVKDELQAICISGTSATCLVVDETMKVIRQPRMYNFDVRAAKEGQQVLEYIQKYAPPQHNTLSSTSSLAKLLLWHYQEPLSPTARLCHQADYVVCKLLFQQVEPLVITSDWHNCLKLGYDLENLEWPQWLLRALEDANLSPKVLLPQHVLSPGQKASLGISQCFVKDEYSRRWNFPENVQVIAGTTDSNAAFFAATNNQATLGTAVVSLGSTLAIKQVSGVRIEDASRGVYSHRFPSSSKSSKALWLAGGASNVGCAVLRQENFSNEELEALSAEIDPGTDSQLNYYPLVGKGERFPVADSEKDPVLEPKPSTRSEYLKAILQGINDVEIEGFRAVCALGGSPPSQIFTCGGGSRNDVWTQMRERRLRTVFGSLKGVEVAENTEASYGAALLAKASSEDLKKD